MVKRPKTIEQLADEKRKSIEKISETKTTEMSRLNTLNNAVIFWRVVKENNLNIDEELKNIIILARKIARLKKVYPIDKPIDELFRLLSDPF